MPPTPSRSSTTYGPMLIAGLNVGKLLRASPARRAVLSNVPETREDRFEEVSRRTRFEERLNLAAQLGIGTARVDERFAFTGRPQQRLRQHAFRLHATRRRPSA